VSHATMSAGKLFHNRAPAVAKARSPRWHCVVVSMLASINVVNQHWGQLLLGLVTTCGQVNHLGM